MPSNNINRVSSNNPVRRQTDSKDSVFGIYLAEVVATKDISRTGRIRVFIPAISKDKNTTAGYFDAVWTSPFAGSTDPRAIGNDPTKPEQTISSYGFWAVPPDNGNLVLVAFGDGNTKYPLVISCLFPDKFNYMLPSNPGGDTFQSPGIKAPTMEKNKKDGNTNHNNAPRPIQHTLAEAITKQGLINDPIRGAGNSSARRESPSEVFGILTPGPRDPSKFDYRLGGHSITLDDNLSSRNIRIRTAQGNQILLDDTSGVMYFINKEGKVWMEFNQSGDVMLYAEGSISMRSRGDFSIRADQDVNIEAGQSINIKAAADNVGGDYIGEGAGTGGFINMHSMNDMHMYSKKSYFLTTEEGGADMNFAGEHNVTSGADYNHKVTGNHNNEISKGMNFTVGADVINEVSAGYVIRTGSQILLNSGGGDATTPKAAALANPPTTVEQKDQGREQPGYDKEADNPITTAGNRQGDIVSIKTIVGVLVTAEPFAGHALPDPASDNPESMTPDPSAASDLPANSTGVPGPDGSVGPADANTPSGVVTSAVAGATAAASGATSAATSTIKNAASNFGMPGSKNIAALSDQVAGKLNATIPPIRKPKVNPIKQKILGVMTAVKEIEARANMIPVLPTGGFGDLGSGKFAAMKDSITNAITTATSESDKIAKLKSAGITAIADGAGTIYQDIKGNKIVDFSSSLGKEGVKLITVASLNSVNSSISPLIKVPVSDNQMAAMMSFAGQVGVSNFANSKVLEQLNERNYAGVPNLLLQYSQGSYDSTSDPVFREDMYQRRQMEGELFQTPDAVKLPVYENNVSFAQQAADIKSARITYLNSISG